MLPKTEKGIRNRIQKYRNNLAKEKRIFGAYRDGGGIRYVIFYFLYLNPMIFEIEYCT